MNKNLRKAVNAAINGLDWAIIAEFCADQTGNKKKADIKKALKESIVSAINSMIASDIDEMSITLFTISIRGGEGSHIVQIAFTPTKSIATEDRSEQTDEEERAVIEEMLEKAIKEEKYELAAALRDQLRRVQ